MKLENGYTVDKPDTDNELCITISMGHGDLDIYFTKKDVENMAGMFRLDEFEKI